ncbi:MAG TPA: RNB domain-containing ribonuclease [Desulfonatronum sp.]|nr:RNB domain-containing ribonuclease [Desulfonatronum sp.]
MAIVSLPPGPGSIVEYLQDNEPQMAMVLEEQNGRLRLFTRRGRETTMPASRLLPWVGPRHPLPSSRAEMEERLARHQEMRHQAASVINVMEIWTLAQGELESASLEWFAGLIWDNPDADKLAALGRALLDAKTHFKFQPPLFLIHSQEIVSARLAEQEAARKSRELVLAGQDFFVDLWKSGKVINPPEEIVARELADLLLRRIRRPEDQADDPLWRNLTKKIPEHPHQALLLAQAWGLLPPHYNYLLDQTGYDWQDDWSQVHAREIQSIHQKVTTQKRSSDVTELISVDSESTRDIDDAFSLSRTEDKGFELTMAIACPCLDWPWNSELDMAVADRASSLYLPEGVSHMLPELLGTEVFSLRAHKTRPALFLQLWLDARGMVEKFSPRMGWVELQENTHYLAVEKAIEACVEPYSAAFELAVLLRDARISQGAVVFDQPDPEFILTGDKPDPRILLEPKPASPKAQLLVSELMILANTETARWANQQDLPLIYRTQNVALPPGSAGQYTRPEDMYRMSRLLANATLRTKPDLHASLGVRAYASVTSPLRRYVDFLNISQVMHLLMHGRARLCREEMETGLPQWKARLEAVNRIQRYRIRYWKLLYLRQQGQDHLWPAVLVDETHAQAVFALPAQQILVRAPKRLIGEKCFVGNRYLLRIGKVDPLLNEIKVLEVREDQTDR